MINNYRFEDIGHDFENNIIKVQFIKTNFEISFSLNKSDYQN